MLKHLELNKHVLCCLLCYFKTYGLSDIHRMLRIPKKIREVIFRT